VVRRSESGIVDGPGQSANAFVGTFNVTYAESSGGSVWKS